MKNKQESHAVYFEAAGFFFLTLAVFAGCYQLVFSVVKNLLL